MRLSVAHRCFWKKMLSCASDTALPANIDADCVCNKIEQRPHVNIDESELRDAV